MNFPKDPIMLLSYVNTKLRDEFDSLDKLCDSLETDKSELCDKLALVDYRYDEKLNKFI